MPCAPLDEYEGPSEWAMESSASVSRDPYEMENAIAIAITPDMERTYRMTLRENGMSAGEGVSILDHMRAIGLLPSV